MRSLLVPVYLLASFALECVAAIEGDAEIHLDNSECQNSISCQAVIRNESSKTITITKVETECGCISARIANPILKADDKTEVFITLSDIKGPGSYTKRIMLTADSGELFAITISIATPQVLKIEAVLDQTDPQSFSLKAHLNPSYTDKIEDLVAIAPALVNLALKSRTTYLYNFRATFPDSDTISSDQPTVVVFRAALKGGTVQEVRYPLRIPKK